MPAPLLSQNGYAANNRGFIRSVVIPGTDVKVAVRKGAAGDLLLYVASRWHREVEPLRAPDGVLDCWGYAERMVRGSSTSVSNHASGTALDFRARIHPLGKRGTYKPGQVAAIRRILADCRGAIRWGGDYVSRADEMHVEVVASEAACARVLAQLTSIDHPARPTPTPTPRPALPAEEDDVDLHITPDQNGQFRAAAKVEAGAGTATGYTKAWITLSSLWGDANFVVTALGSGGPLWQWNGGQTGVPFRVETNTHWAVELPAETRTVTVEGSVAAVGAVPAGAVWHVR